MKPINFRIDKALYQRLESIKEFLGSHLSISDIVRNLLDSSVQRLPEQLKQENEPNPYIIADRADKGLPLTKKELEALTNWATQAYSFADNQSSTYSHTRLPCKQHLLDILCMLDVAISEARFDQEGKHYFTRRLDQLTGFTETDDNHHRHNRSNNSDPFTKKINSLKDKIQKQGLSTSQAKHLTETLYALVRDEELATVRPERLNLIFQPYVKTLCILAKFYLNTRENKQPILHYPDKPAFLNKLFPDKRKPAIIDDTITKNDSDFFISILFHENLPTKLTKVRMKEKPGSTGYTFYFDFMRLNDLIMLLDYLEAMPEQLTSSRGCFYEIQKTSEHDAYYLKSLTDTYTPTIELLGKEFEDVKSLLYMLRDKYKPAWQELTIQWGAW